MKYAKTWNCRFKLILYCEIISDLEWRIIYVGSAESMEHDQVLDTILVGPVPGGKHMFVFEVVSSPVYIH